MTMPLHQLPPFAHGAKRPRFADLLASALQLKIETRPWVNDALGYQYVRQSRKPVGLPQVMAKRCVLSGLLAAADASPGQGSSM